MECTNTTIRMNTKKEFLRDVIYKGWKSIGPLAGCVNFFTFYLFTIIFYFAEYIDFTG